MKKYRGPVSIGLRDICYAMLTEDTEDGTTYNAVVKGVAGAINATVSPQSESTKQYADDGINAEVTSLGDVNISIELSSIPDEVQAEWFGHTKNADGVLISNKDDAANHFALGFRSLNHDGSFRHVWVYKVLASLPENVYQTKEGSNVTMQTQKVTLACSPRVSDGKWMARVNSNDDKIGPAVIGNWFNAPYELTIL